MLEFNVKFNFQLEKDERMYVEDLQGILCIKCKNLIDCVEMDCHHVTVTACPTFIQIYEILKAGVGDIPCRYTEKEKEDGQKL